jgi:hypothetical protein
VHGAEKDRFDLGAEVGQIDFFEGCHVGVAGIVDDHVQPAETVDGGLDCRVRLIRVGYVGWLDWTSS